MVGFFKSLFAGTAGKERPEDKVGEEASEKERQRKFDILKYDGLKALKIGKTGYAARCFREALALQEEFQTLTYLAAACVRLQEPEEALAVYDRLAELDPGFKDTFLERARLYYGEKKPEQALEECSRALALDETDHRVYLLMARVYRQLDRQEDAVAACTKAAEQAEGKAEALLLRIELYVERNQPQEALEDARVLIALHPEEEGAYLLRGRAYEALKLPEKALEDYRQVIELDPFNEQGYLEAARVLIQEGQAETAAGLLDEAIEQLPGCVGVYIARAKTKEVLGDAAGSVADLKTAEELQQNDSEREYTTVNFNDLYTHRPL